MRLEGVRVRERGGEGGGIAGGGEEEGACNNICGNKTSASPPSNYNHNSQPVTKL